MKTSLSKLSIAIAAASLTFTNSDVLASTKVSRIIGGVESVANSYPWIVSLQTQDGEHFCGASLIAPDWVMTAAHCVEEESPSMIKAVISEYDLTQSEPSEQVRQIKQIVSHDEYGDDHDIALLQLNEAVTHQIISRASPEQLEAIAAGTPLKVMGWGNRQVDGEDFPNVLHEVTVNKTQQAECAEAYEQIGTEITSNMICAGVPGGGKDSCQGDSGGPLVMQYDNQWLQLGIVSFGEGCAMPDFKGVYTNVAAYQDWIKQAQLSIAKPELDEEGDEETHHPYEDEQAFGLPDYVLIETDALTGDIERRLTLSNTSDADLRIKQIEIESFSDNFDDEDHFDEEDGFDDDEDFDHEDHDYDEDDRLARSDMEHLEDAGFYIKQDTCSQTTLAPDANCEIVVAMSDNTREERSLARHWPDELVDEDDFENEEDEFHDDEDFEHEDDEFHDDEDFEHEDHDTDNVHIIEQALVIETDHADHDIVEVPLIGIISLPEPKVEGPELLEFHAKNANQSITETVELDNTSEDYVTITNVDIHGSDRFTISNNACLAETIAPEKSCSLDVSFTPGDSTEAEAAMLVTYDNGEVLEIELIGLTYSLIEDDYENEDHDEGEFESDNLADMLDWYFNGETPWGLSNSEAFELVTDLLSENDESMLMTEIEGPATLDFDFNLEGDQSENELSFVVDGKVVKTINGNSLRNQHSTELSAGKHTVQWVYKKKSANSNAKATVSNVRVKPKEASITNASDTSTESGGGSAGWGLLTLLAGLIGARRFRK